MLSLGRRGGSVRQVKTRGIGSDGRRDRGRPVRRASAPVDEGPGPTPAVQPASPVVEPQPLTDDRDPVLREGEKDGRRRPAHPPPPDLDEDVPVAEEAAGAVRAIAAEVAYRRRPSTAAPPPAGDDAGLPPEPGSELDVEA